MRPEKKKQLPLAALALTALLLAMGLLTARNFILGGGVSLAQKPDAIVADFDDLWNRAVTGKVQLTKLNTLFSYYFTGTLDSTEVVLGRENWLFYSSTQDGDPIADYEGHTVLDEDTITKWMVHTQQEMERLGAQFVLVLPPNKEQVYPEYMPARYHQAQESAVDRLTARLEEAGINVANPKQALLEAKSKYQVYYKYDTHWNQLGGYIGARQALEKVGISLAPLEERTITSQLLTPIRHYCAGEDLASILAIDWPYQDDLEYTVEGTAEIDWENLARRQEGPADEHRNMTIYTNPDAPRPEIVMLIGDSFRSAMLPVLVQEFQRVDVVMLSRHQLNNVYNSQPDIVIWEVVERRSPLLQEGCKKIAGDM